MSTVNRLTRLICVATEEYPIYLSELNVRVPGTIFPNTIDSEELSKFGYDVVEDTPAPTADFVTEGKPELGEDYKWHRTWITRNFTDTEVAQQLVDAKSLRTAEIDSFVTAQFAKGFPYQFGDQLYHVQVRAGDRQNISSIRVIAKEAIDAGKTLPVSFRVYENVTVRLTAEEFVALADTTFARVTEGYQAGWNLKDAVTAATSKEELPTIPSELFASVESFSFA